MLTRATCSLQLAAFPGTPIQFIFKEIGWIIPVRQKNLLQIAECEDRAASIDQCDVHRCRGSTTVLYEGLSEQTSPNRQDSQSWIPRCCQDNLNLRNRTKTYNIALYNLLKTQSSTVSSTQTDPVTTSITPYDCWLLLYTNISSADYYTRSAPPSDAQPNITRRTISRLSLIRT